MPINTARFERGGREKRLGLPKKLVLEIENLAQRKLVFACYKFPQVLSLEDRKQFRQLLAQSIQKQAFYKKNSRFMDLKSLLKPGLKPEQALMAISISHCKDLALFVFTFKKSPEENLSIGIDIEKTQRVSPALVSRISKEEELLQSPKPSLLWVAKEASFKSFSGGKKTLLLSECHISSWQKKKKSYHFQAQYKAQKSKGIAFQWGKTSLAYSQTHT